VLSYPEVKAVYPSHYELVLAAASCSAACLTAFEKAYPAAFAAFVALIPDSLLVLRKLVLALIIPYPYSALLAFAASVALNLDSILVLRELVPVLIIPYPFQALLAFAASFVALETASFPGVFLVEEILFGPVAFGKGLRSKNFLGVN
jgi:hypothetical protein